MFSYIFISVFNIIYISIYINVYIYMHIPFMLHAPQTETKDNHRLHSLKFSISNSSFCTEL